MCRTSQSDGRQAFGEKHPQRVAELSQRFLAPWGGALRRYPVGRKGYNGRVERRHRTDDEEFYRPYLLQIQDVPQFLELSARWVYIYTVCRPHKGVGMANQPPLAVLQRLGYTGDGRMALFPLVLLDAISTDLLLACDPETSNDLWGPLHSHVVVRQDTLLVGNFAERANSGYHGNITSHRGDTLWESEANTR